VGLCRLKCWRGGENLGDVVGIFQKGEEKRGVRPLNAIESASIEGGGMGKAMGGGKISAPQQQRKNQKNTSTEERKERKNSNKCVGVL